MWAVSVLFLKTSNSMLEMYAWTLLGRIYAVISWPSPTVPLSPHRVGPVYTCNQQSRVDDCPVKSEIGFARPPSNQYRMPRPRGTPMSDDLHRLPRGKHWRVDRPAESRESRRDGPELLLPRSAVRRLTRRGRDRQPETSSSLTVPFRAT